MSTPAALEADPSLRTRLAPWAPILDAIAETHGLDAERAAFPTGSLPVFAVGGRVVKLYDRPVDHDAESEALRRLDGRAPVPALLGSGAEGPWRYVVMERVEGTALERVLPTLDVEARHRALREAGALLRRIHDAPTEGLPSPVPEFERFFAGQPVAKKLPTPFAREADRFFAEVPRMEADARFLHTEIGPDHLLCAPEGTATGLIDLVEVMVGDGAYDLAVAAFFFARGDGPSLRALLDGYGFAGLGGASLARGLLRYLLLHRFAPFAWLAARRPFAATNLGELAEEWIGSA